MTPGVGTQVFDGWYNVLMVSPMHMDIRANSTATDLSGRMPNLTSQPGPGVEQPSLRDITNAAVLIDTLNQGVTNADTFEAGQYIVDRIEVRGYDLIAD